MGKIHHMLKQDFIHLFMLGEFLKPLFVHYVNLRSLWIIIIFITVSIQSNWQATNPICEIRRGLLIMCACPSVSVDIINMCASLYALVTEPCLQMCMFVITCRWLALFHVEYIICACTKYH